jgi:hypothetical protein
MWLVSLWLTDKVVDHGTLPPRPPGPLASEGRSGSEEYAVNEPLLGIE